MPDLRFTDMETKSPLNPALEFLCGPDLGSSQEDRERKVLPIAWDACSSHLDTLQLLCGSFLWSAHSHRGEGGQRRGQPELAVPWCPPAVREVKPTREEAGGGFLKQQPFPPLSCSTLTHDQSVHLSVPLSLAADPALPHTEHCWGLSHSLAHSSPCVCVADAEG